MASQYDDNLFFKMIYAISDIAVLSILWFIGSLPLVTIGASMFHDAERHKMWKNRGFLRKMIVKASVLR